MNMNVVKYRKERQSGVELLRIIAMFLVLLIHANAWGEKWEYLNFDHSIGKTITTILFQTLSCVCVNIFVLISGWFGIQFSMKGLLKFLFQCMFFLFGIYFFMIALGKTNFSISGFAGCLMFLKWNWFIKTYLVLYIMSPILNRFMAQTNERELRRLLILFYTFQTLYGWLTNGAAFFEYGQSVTSFVGLYLLAQYVRMYKFKRIEEYGGAKIIMLSIGMFSALFFLTLFSVFYKVDFVTGKIFAYTSPCVILASLCLLILFVIANKKFTNTKLNHSINQIAASSFAVFLLHTNPCVFQEYYQSFFVGLFDNYIWQLFILYSLLTMLAVYFVAVVIDQLRIFLWNKLVPLIFN